MKNKILSTVYLQEKYRHSLGEFSNTSNGVLKIELRGLTLFGACFVRDA